jgi:hypothetical protein
MGLPAIETQELKLNVEMDQLVILEDQANYNRGWQARVYK